MTKIIAMLLDNKTSFPFVSHPFPYFQCCSHTFPNVYKYTVKNLFNRRLQR